MKLQLQRAAGRWKVAWRTLKSTPGVCVAPGSSVKDSKEGVCQLGWHRGRLTSRPLAGDGRFFIFKN